MEVSSGQLQCYRFFTSRAAAESYFAVVSSGDFCFLAILVCFLVHCSYIICLVIIFLFEFKSYLQVLLVLASFACKFYLKILLTFQDFEKIKKYYIFLKFCNFLVWFQILLASLTCPCNFCLQVLLKNFTYFSRFWKNSEILYIFEILQFFLNFSILWKLFFCY